MKRWLMGMIVGLWLLAAHPAAQDSVNEQAALSAQLKTNSRPLSYSAGKLAGAGADWLRREAQRARFCLIGEEHGFAENPLFAAALLAQLDGYQYFAAEIGTLTAARLEAAARQQSARAVLAEFNHRYPFSLPFFNWQEEGELLATALKLPGKAPRLWGLDQEFFFSPVYHFERLRQLAPNARARALVQTYCDKTQGELAHATATHNPGTAFLVTATAADFDQLDAAFGQRNDEAQRILRALRESAEIYQKNARGEIYANNLQRSQLLKRNFMAFYNAALQSGPPPKVFFKFGAGHVMRGRNYINVFDLGNFVAELAESQGATSFHVLVVAAGGTYNKFFPFVGNEADKRKPFVPANVYGYADLQAFVSLAATPGWQVVDLRPLRARIGTRALPVLPRGILDILIGFDAVVLVDEAHPATFYE